jgi:hypothetical protein
MPNRSRKKAGKDVNQIARSVVDQATGTSPQKKLPRPVKKRDAADVDRAESEGMAQPQGMRPEKAKKKDPAAVALGRKGGLKGGRARADKLTADERTASARKAAQARWARGL